MVTSEKHQKSLLGGIECLVGLAHPDLLPAVPKILMELYQIDAIEEEVVTQWGTHVSKKFVDKETSKRVRKASEPFLKVSNPLTFSLCEKLGLIVLLSGSKKLMMTTKMTSDYPGRNVLNCSFNSLHLLVYMHDQLVIPVPVILNDRLRLYQPMQLHFSDISTQRDQLR
jgi:hypothetical protein